MGAYSWGGGHPQGVPLRLVNVGALMLTWGEGTHKGCPYGWFTWARTHKGCPYGWFMWARSHEGEGTHKGCPSCGRATHGGRAPTRGAPTVGGGEGTHKGCPYGWFMGAYSWGGGHPQGVPLRLGPETSATVGGVSRCLNQDLQKLRIIRMAASLSLPIQRIHLASIRRGVGREAADRDRWGVYGDLTRPIIAAMMGRGGCGPVPA